VVQGVGCLNYSLVLPIDDITSNLQQTNHFVMSRQRDALQTLSNNHIEIRGTTDLALVTTDGERKFSGNAQRRKKNWLLFHGTILLDFELNLISQLLNFPSRQPDYRASRKHLDFICNFPASREDVRNALREVWDAHRVLDEVPHARIEQLANETYARDEWNFRL
jgi:lipoate-protein ligase A